MLSEFDAAGMKYSTLFQPDSFNLTDLLRNVLCQIGVSNAPVAVV